MAVNAYLTRPTHFAVTAAVLLLIYIVFHNSVFYYFSRIAHIFLYSVIATLTYPLCKRLYNDEEIGSDNKAVLITGCDSGFGNQLAKKLDSKGFQVFASCLFIQGPGATELKQTCSNRLRILHLDVTKDDTIEQAVCYVKNNLGSNVLWAVVNNAGIAKGFTTDLSTIEDFKVTIDVNALGPVRITKAFLPFLKKAKGRVVNVTSLAGRISTLEICAYAMSKYAAVAFTECLSQEMIPWGVRVISIEPEFFRTGLTNPENIFQRMESDSRNFSEDIRASYGEDYFEKLKKLMSFSLNFVSCTDLSIVVNAIERAIIEENPEYVYKPRRNLITWAFYTIVQYMPYELFEISERLLMMIIGYPVPRAVQQSF